LQEIGLFAVTEFQCTEDEHDYEDEDDSKFRNLDLTSRRGAGAAPTRRLRKCQTRARASLADATRAKSQIYEGI